MRRLRHSLLTAHVALAALSGCQSSRQVPATIFAPASSTTAPSATTAAATQPADPHTYDADLETLVLPPAGWRLDPPKRTPQHIHKTWLSPTGDTAYGIIRFKLPLPLNEDLCLWGFMSEMRHSEGEGILVNKSYDPALPGIRFVAEGGLYKIRTNMMVSGLRGWCVYAGSLRARAENPAELAQAAAARDATIVHVDQASTQPAPLR